MLTFMMQKTVKGKRSAVMVIDPDDIDRMKAGKPVAVDFTQDERNKIQLVLVVGFTPDREALQKELDSTKAGRWRVDAEQLLEILTRCQELPEKRSDRPN